jgi:hypothetical protein
LGISPTRWLAAPYGAGRAAARRRRRRSRAGSGGPQALRASAVGEQIQLLLFDSVFQYHRPHSGVLIEGARVSLVGRQGGDHEARILPFGQVLGLDNDALCTAPALKGLVVARAEDARPWPKACPCRAGRIGPARLRSSLPTNTATSGSWRRRSWSLTPSYPRASPNTHCLTGRARYAQWRRGRRDR